MKTVFHVALRVGSHSTYCQEVLRGISDYTSRQRNWRFIGDPLHTTDLAKDGISETGCDGMLVYETRWKMLELYEKAGVPVVNTSGFRNPSGLPTVYSNRAAAGVLAVDYLWSLGIQKYVLVQKEIQRSSLSPEMAETAAAYLSEKGGQVLHKIVSDDTRKFDHPAANRLGAVLLSSSEPVGIICESDLLAVHCIHQIKIRGIPLPEKAAVIGCGDEDLVCQFSSPTLSSIVTNRRHIGFLAATKLDLWMQGQAPSRLAESVDPGGVRARESTDLLHIQDPKIETALRYLRSHACEGIQVQDILNHVEASRSKIEKGIKRAIGKSPQEEIRRIQLDRMKILLATTDLKIREVAIQTGFQDPRYMSQVFLKEMKLTPTEYRRMRKQTGM